MELSMHDKGGRSQWEAYSLASSSGAGGSGAGSSRQGPPSSSATPGPSSSSRPAPSSQSSQPPTYGGYVPSSATPAVASVQPHQSPSTVSTVSSVTVTSSSPVSVHSNQDSIPIVTRVRALHTFEPSEPGELAFEKGDIIIDGGNSHYPDSIRRTKELEAKGFLFVGSGVSGGEEGARYGPSPSRQHSHPPTLSSIPARVTFHVCTTHPVEPQSSQSITYNN